MWFETGHRFSYHRDPDKTAAAWNDRGLATIGDIGRLDDEGYNYLTDRRATMIISGAVNIYPREIEDILVVHPLIEDVAVLGVPDEAMDEQVKAFVQLRPGVAASACPAAAPWRASIDGGRTVVSHGAHDAALPKGAKGGVDLSPGAARATVRWSRRGIPPEAQVGSLWTGRPEPCCVTE